MASDKDDTGGALVSAKVTGKAALNVTDIGGLGKAAKSPAGKEIARAIAAPLGNAIDTATTALLGRKAARVRAEARILEAETDAHAKLIAATAEEEVRRLRVTARRVRNEELRKTDYIESTAHRSILIADQRGDKDAAPLSDELTLSWIDGVKDAHSEVVRDLYARILANQTKTGGDVVSGPSLALLKNLDSPLAEAFKRFVAIQEIFGNYPYMTQMQYEGPLKLQHKETDLLQELGFIRVVNMGYYMICNIMFRPKFPMICNSLYFTRRSQNLSEALFGPNPIVSQLSAYAQSEESIVDVAYNLLIDFTKEFPGEMFIYAGSLPKYAIELVSPKIINDKKACDCDSEQIAAAQDAVTTLDQENVLSATAKTALVKFLSQQTDIKMHKLGK